jgi:3',5'-cyclic AMP phosphodiesterase CpdA
MRTRMSTNGAAGVQPDMFSVLHLSDIHFGSAYRFRPRVLKHGDVPVLEPFGNLADLATLIGDDLSRISEDAKIEPERRALASRIDLLVISGDLGQSGGRDTAAPLRPGGPTNEYDQAWEFIVSLLDRINSLRAAEDLSPLTAAEHVITVPGNHDVNWDADDDSPERFYQYARFWKKLTGSPEFF